MRRTVTAALVFVLTLSFASTASASYPTGKYGDGASVTYTYYDRDGDGTLSWDDSITLTATPPSGVYWSGDIGGVCYQGWASEAKPGTLVYSAYYWLNTTWTRTYRLDSQAWADGTGAYCRFYGVFPDGRKVYTFGDIYFPVNP